MKSVLDSRQLLAASVLARTGSFTATGHQLCLTQSAVSHSIKSLEQDLECKLFERTGRGVTVTGAGKHFVEQIEKILDQMETARTLVAPRTTRGKQQLRLGVSVLAREHFLPIVLPLFQQDFPHKLIAIDPADFPRNLEMLRSGLLDLIFSVKPTGRSNFGFVNLFEDELRYVVGENHPWARTRRASSDEVGMDTLLLFQKINHTQELLENYFKTEGITWRNVVGMADYQSIQDLVKTNLAVGIMPPWLVARELSEGKLVSIPMGPRPLVCQWGLAYLPESPLAVMDRRFIELCQQAVPGVLSRLQGLFTAPLGNKESRSAAFAESQAKVGCVACLFGLLYNFFNESAAWENFGSILSAAS